VVGCQALERLGPVEEVAVGVWTRRHGVEDPARACWTVGHRVSRTTAARVGVSVAPSARAHLNASGFAMLVGERARDTNTRAPRTATPPH
jgi:hypothetical protein